MKRINILLGTLLLASLVGGWAQAHAQSSAISEDPTLDDARRAIARQNPLFIENHGQWDPQARYLARFNGLDLWVTDRSIVYDLYRTERSAGTSAAIGGAEGLGRSGHVVRMNFLGASATGTAVRGSEPASGRYSYFTGADRDRWGNDLQGYARATIEHLYDGIDAVLYVDDGRPRYDLVVAPGGDPSSIRIGYEGVQGVRVGRDGDLLLATSMGELSQQELFAYQMVDGAARKVDCAFRIAEDGSVGFALGHYDAARPLVIDPLVYGTYLGGSAWDEATAIAVDRGGNIYVTGFTLSTDFPVRAGSYQFDYAGSAGSQPGGDIFVTKINPSSNTPVIYSTYIGGIDDDIPFDIALDSFGSAYIAGTAPAGSFPTTDTLRTPSGRGTFVLKLSPSGSGVVYSTFVADGAMAPEGGIAVNARGEAHVAGGTTAGTLRVSTGAFMTAARGSSDAFVVVLDSAGGAFRYATYLGGADDETATDIAIDSSGIYVTGRTASADFPVRNAFDSSYNGETDGFIARLDMRSSGPDQLAYGTYIGGVSYDSPEGMALFRGSVYLTGTTVSGNFPTRFPFQNINRGTNAGGRIGDAFILRINPTTSPMGQIGYSTYFGGSGPDIGRAIAVDSSGNAHVAGWTGSITSFFFTRNAIDTIYGGDSADAFVVKVTPEGVVDYSTYIGGSAGDKANDLALDANGGVYVAGYTQSLTFRTSANAVSRTLSGNYPAADAFVVKFTIVQLLSPNGGEALCAGTPATIRWTGGIGTPYTIAQSSNGGASYQTIATNVTGNSYTWAIPSNFPPGTTYRLRVSAVGGESDTSDANFTINAPPAVGTNPVDQSRPAGGSATFRATFTGTPAPTLQWERDNGDGSGFTPIAGATSGELVVSDLTTASNGYRYRVVAANSCGTITSAAARLTVFGVTVTAPNGGAQIYCAGQTYPITWTSIETAGPFDLFAIADGGGSVIPIASSVAGTTFDWTIPPGIFGGGFRVYVRSSDAQTQDRSDTTFTIRQPVVIVAGPRDITVERGATAEFTVVTPTLPPPTVVWESSADGTSWTPVPGATELTLTIPDVTTAMNGLRYRAVLTSECGGATTDPATLTVSTTGLGVDDGAAPQSGMRLSASPNPVSAEGTIHLVLPRAGKVRLTVVDASGRVVARPVDGALGAGEHAVRFDAASLPNGTYFVDLAVDGERRSIRVTVAR